MLDRIEARKIFERIEEALQAAVEEGENINDCMWYVHIQLQKLREMILGDAEKWVEIPHQTDSEGDG